MRTQQHHWGGVTATVYHMDAGEKIERHQHPVEHTTAVLAGQSKAEIFGFTSPRIMTPADESWVLPANIDHEITALENGTIVMNMIVGSVSGDGVDGKDGGVTLVDE